MKLLRFRKLALSLVTICFLMVSLVFSTYAFVILNDNVDIDSFDYKIESDIGLWASLDGENYSQDITKESLVSVIEKNLGESLSEFTMEGITPDADENGKLKFDENNSIMFKQDYITTSTSSSYTLTTDTSYSSSNTYFVANYVKVENLTEFDSNTDYYQLSLVDQSNGFDKTKTYCVVNSSDSAKYCVVNISAFNSKHTYYEVSKAITDSNDSNYVAATDGVFYTLSYSRFEGKEFDTTYKIAYYEYNETDTYSHGYKESKKYISFDIWFKIVNVSEIDTTKSYNLLLNDNTSIKTKNDESVTITPLNNLTALVDNTITDIGPTKDVKTLSIDPSNAIRLAVVNEDEYKNSSDTTTTSGLYVFEKSGGLGSSAVENYSSYEALNNNIHNKECNAMYTYYNSTYQLYPFTSAATYNESFNTYDLNSLTSVDASETTLGTFTYDTTNKTYNTLKLKISIYLEGWDADYLTGLASQSLTVTLGFKIS